MNKKYIVVILVCVSLFMFNKSVKQDSPSHIYAQMSYEINKSNDPVEIVMIMKKYASNSAQPLLDKSINDLNLMRDTDKDNYAAFLSYFKNYFSPEYNIKGLKEVSINENTIRLDIYNVAPNESYKNSTGIINTAYTPMNSNDVAGGLNIFVLESGSWKMSTISSVMLKSNKVISYLE